MNDKQRYLQTDDQINIDEPTSFDMRVKLVIGLHDLHIGFGVIQVHIPMCGDTRAHGFPH